MRPRLVRRISVVLLIALLCSLVPTSSAWQSLLPADSPLQGLLPQETTHADGLTDDPADPLVTVTPVADPHLPSLTLTVDAAPRELVVGSVCTLTVTLTNLAADAASNVAVTLPLPASSASYPDPQSNPTGWTWSLASLAGGATTTFTATVSLTAMPTGAALLASPQVTADGLPTAITATGGAWVAATSPTNSAAATTFTPGTAQTLTSADNTTTVQMPDDTTTISLTVQFSRVPGPADPAASEVAGYQTGFGSFYLNATDGNNTPVHQLDKPVTLTVAYTPEQLRALGLTEDQLTIYWFDPSQGTDGAWVPLGTDVDSSAHTATVQVAHFSRFQLSDGSSPSAAFVPSLQGWQVGLYTGDASYSYPIDLPAGPGGLKPSLSLNYDSSATDGGGGKRASAQASWVGKGWSLQTGYVAQNKISDDPAKTRYYSLVFNGQSFDLMRGEALVVSPTLSNPTNWAWHPTDESFIRARVITGTVATGNPWSNQAGRGWFLTNTTNPQPRYVWQVWTKDGTRYDFAEDAFWGWRFCPARGGYMEANKWYLSQVTDTHGNTITYSYDHATQVVTDSCNGVNIGGTNDYDVWPTSITWGGGRYKVTLVSQARVFDTLAPDHESAQLGYAPQETRQLNAIQVSSMPTSTWQLMHQYNLGYYTPTLSLTSDAWSCNNGTCTPEGTQKLTLKQIQQVGSDGVSALPPVVFSYGLTRGTGTFPNGNWNRLTSADNGHGGTISFTYQNIASALGGGPGYFDNNRRVTSKTLTSNATSPAVTYTWVYTYYDPAYNSLGIAQGGQGPNTNTNSATVYYDEQVDPAHAVENRPLLVHPRYTEFRGHSHVIEHDPNGNETDHYFVQGDTGVNPSVIGTGIPNNPTFQDLRDRELEKGREWKTETYNGTVSTGQKLHTVQHDFRVQFYDYSTDIINGLWRAFPYEWEQTDQTWEGGSTALTQRTDYSYDPTGHEPGNVQYGNLTEVDDLDPAGAVYRRTFHDYTVLSTTTSFLVDREVATYVKDGATNWLALSLKLYDDASYGSTGSQGNLAQTCAVSNIPLTTLSTSLPGSLTCTDTHYEYDSYGNVQYTSTYSDTGSATWNGSIGSFSPTRTHSSANARTTANGYDSTFHAFLTVITMPVVSGITLTETATYSPTQGVLMSVTDANGNTTQATYDIFDRQVSYSKPGDSPAAPTTQVTYFDWNVPFRYLVNYKESGTTYRPVKTFYDGLGRIIQTKSESARDGSGNGTQNIVVDKVYDGLGQVRQESQPRYVDQTGNDFRNYLAPAQIYTPTLTSYDALGRVTQVDPPDHHVTTTSYTITNGLQTVNTVDAGGHKTGRGSDVFGRLRQVDEYTGTSGSWTVYATSVYTYNPLDLLTGVRDANGQVTTVAYDSLGRKLTMSDPTMGAWSYNYDANGNLWQQTDAKGQQITFAYDAQDRLRGKTYTPSTAGNPVTYNYDEATASNGKGQLTSVGIRIGGSPAITTTWQYDARGRKTTAVYDISGLGGPLPTFQWHYDSGDRLTQLDYPGGETVSYTYDAAWRPTSAHSSLGPYYVQNARYAQALDQPTQIGFGNTLTQTTTYDPVTQRLTQMQVGSLSNPSSVLNRSYTYYNQGNIHTISDHHNNETQSFQYDPRDRLNFWSVTGSPDQTYTYDKLGNFQSKAGVSYTYGTGNGGPYAVRSTSLWSQLQYDLNGNLTSQQDGVGDSRTLTWNADNQPTSITTNGVSEQYVYNGNGERIARTASGVTTYYFEGLWEQDVPVGQSNTGATRSFYLFNSQVVAQRSITYDLPTPTPGATNTPTRTPTATPTRTPTNTPTPLPCPSVIWTNLQNISSNGNDIQKTGGTYSWDDAGGDSQQALQSGDGSVQITVDATTTDRMFGLTHNDTGVSYTSIDYAIDLQSNGTLLIYENGTSRITAVSYSVGDVLKVAVVGGQVKYYENSTLLYTSLSTPSYPLAMDASIYTPNAYLKVATICGNIATPTRTPTNTPTPTPSNTPTQTPTPTATPADGLKGTYYDSPDFTTLRMIRYDVPIDFNWGGGSASEQLDPTGFSIRWTGRVKAVDGANGTGTYTFHLRTTGGVRLWVNDQLLIDDWTEHAYTEDTGQIALVAGQYYPLRLEYLDTSDPTAAEIHLLWEPPGSGLIQTGPQLLDKGTLYPPDPPANEAPLEDLPESGNTLVYLHGDHLGSVSVVTGPNGGVLQQQSFDPWGQIRNGQIITETTRSYTGQIRDSSGLIYDQARYYDPALGRFVSPDSIVPGATTGDAPVQLIVDFHEPNFTSAMTADNVFRQQYGFWFQLTQEERGKAKNPWGPANPQALNRYGYGLDNPVQHVDPSGHSSCTDSPSDKPGCGGVVINNSDSPVWVQGSVKTVLPQCAAYGQDCDVFLGYHNEWQLLPPHTSSADMGIYDADAVSAYDGTVLYEEASGCTQGAAGGYGCYDVSQYHGVYDAYKLTNDTQVVIGQTGKTDANGNQVLSFSDGPKPGIFYPIWELEWLGGHKGERWYYWLKGEETVEGLGWHPVNGVIPQKPPQQQ